MDANAIRIIAQYGTVTISVGPVEIVAVLLPADTETLTNVIVPVGCVAAAVVVDVLLLAPGSTGATIEEVLFVLSVDAGTVDPVFETTVVLAVEVVTVCDIVDDVKELVAFVVLIGIAESGVDPVIVEFVKVVEPAVYRDIIVLLGVDMLDVVD